MDAYLEAPSVWPDVHLTLAALPLIRLEGEPWVKIVDAQSNCLATVIHIVGPAMKRPGQEREGYLRRRIRYLAAGVNVVEIDILRGGQRMPIEGNVPPHCDYYALICRARQMPAAGIWPLSVRDPLPTIPIPLLPADGDVSLDLRACLDRAFEESRFDLKLNYRQAPEPPLSDADSQWARGLLENAAAS